MNKLFHVCRKKFFLRHGKIISTAILLTVSLPSFAMASGDIVANDSATSLQTSTDNSVMTILNNMQDAVLHTDYKISIVLEESSDFSNTLQYRYLGANNLNYGNLIFLEGAPKEIILHDNIVSYFQSDSIAFSLSANRIIEAFPDVVYNDFSKLTDSYDFILLGKARTANRSSQLVRIVPKDKDRYNYVIWIDDKTHLPLRIDLLDLNSKIIKQIKVVTLDLDFNKTAFQSYIEDRDYPILFPIDKETSERNSWQVGWLPKGFKENAAYNINFNQSGIDTKLFSDGIFSFTVNVSELSNNDATHVVTQGARTVYSTNLNNMNIVIIGDLPFETIERIAQSIKTK